MNNYDILKSAFHSNFITQNDVYEQVLNGKISSEDYKMITNEEITDLPLDILKQNKIEALRQTCSSKIINEFYSDCLGELKRFDCEPTTDQAYIQGMFFQASAMVSQYPEIADVPSDELKWKEGVEYGNLKCYPFTPNQIIKLGLDMKVHITEKRLRFEDLRIWILDDNRTVEEVEAISWDTEIL